MNYLERLYEDVFPVKRQYLCNLCGDIGEEKEMKNDQELGWVHWKCLKSYEKMEKQEQVFEWEREQARAERGMK